MKLLVWASILTVSVALRASRAETLAERLGYGPQDKLLIVHADDVGMCHAVNAAAIRGLEEGCISAGSIMVPCPWFPEIAAYCRENPEADFGLHLTLTSEWKYYRWRSVSPIPLVPGLIDPEGFLWSEVPEVVQHASAKEVEREIRAQIERARQFGLRPTHLDTHMGTVFARPDYIEVYCRLGKEYGIPPLLVNRSPELEEILQRMGLSIPEGMFQRWQEAGFVLLDYLVPDIEGRTFEERRDAYYELLRNLKPGVTQLIIHPGLEGEELRHITGSHAQRYADYLVFTAPETKSLLAELGIKLLGWRQLQKLFVP